MAIAEVLARLSEAEARFSSPRAQAKCAQELQELSCTHANSPAWATGGIAAVVRFCHEPASAADAVSALFNLSAAEANWTVIIEAGAIPPLVALLSGRPAFAAADSAKAAGALSNLAEHAAGKAAVISAGAIPPLVALLGGEPESAAAERAAGALRKLAGCRLGRAAIIHAGAIPPLVALLRGRPEVAGKAGWALSNLASDEAAKAAIIEAGAIPPLVALLRGRPESEAAASAAAALCNLASDEAAKAAIIEAAAIPPLVALLSGGPESKAAERAARVLDRLVSGTHTTVAVLEEVARVTAECSFRNSLHAKLSKCASEQRREIYADTERQKRRKAFGLGSYELPNEFMCPITWEKMRGVPSPPPSPLASPAAPPPRLPSLRHRPGGGVRRPLVRAVRYPPGDQRRQSQEPAHPRAAPAERAHTEPQPEEAHVGVRGGLTACGSHRCGECHY